jgi:chemotaxis response regulator CheB
MRILLAGMSNMLSSIITAALEQSPQMIIAGMASERDDLAESVRQTQADAVVMQVAEPGVTSRYHNLLLRFPTLKVIAIASNGKGGFVHELRPWSTQLVELSAATLLAALGEPSRHEECRQGNRD